MFSTFLKIACPIPCTNPYSKVQATLRQHIETGQQPTQQELLQHAQQLRKELQEAQNLQQQLQQAHEIHQLTQQRQQQQQQQQAKTVQINRQVVQAPQLVQVRDGS